MHPPPSFPRFRRTQRFGALVATALSIVAVASCDSRAPTDPVVVGGGSARGRDVSRPRVTIDSPSTAALVNVGDSILVTARATDNSALATITFLGLSFRGAASVGTLDTTIRYPAVVAPGTASRFRAGLRDTVVRRFLRAATPVDSTLDSLVIVAIARDTSGNADTTRQRVNLVSGPRVTFVSPATTDTATAGVLLSIVVNASDADGVARVVVRARGEPGWPTPLNDSIVLTPATPAREVTLTGTIAIPANAPNGGRITLEATARDTRSQLGAAVPRVIPVRLQSTSVPRVQQTVPARVEVVDSLRFTANGDGIAAIGFIVRDSLGALIRRDSVLFSDRASNRTVSLPLALPSRVQGQRVNILGFAIDRAGRYGYGVPSNVTTAQGDPTRATADTTTVVFGITYPFPLGRRAVMGDLVVDSRRERVFVSNTLFNRLELWRGDRTAFTANGVAVGSLPWGLAVGANPDTLLVANSGGTNISQVPLTTADPDQVREAISQRILTRNTVIFSVEQAIDATTGIVTFKLAPPVSYSDRPQYLAQAESRRIYFSSRPTETAPAGTLRYLDPTPGTAGGPTTPDTRQVYQYASATDLPNTYVIFNADSVAIDPGDNVSGTGRRAAIIICDHRYNTLEVGTCIRGSDTPAIVAALNALGGDIVLRTNIDVRSLALRDTNFVAVSSNRRGVAFGEGTVGPAGRIIGVTDLDAPSVAGAPNRAEPAFSSGLAVTDLTDNASERVFGLALDSLGNTIAARGTESSFASVRAPFELRLQGKFDSFDRGAGVAFHPAANGIQSSDDARLAFVASSNGSIEVIDVGYYISRGTIQIRSDLYGPLRVSRRFSTDPPDVVLKLFGLTSDGLVVIDVRQSNIRSSP